MRVAFVSPWPVARASSWSGVVPHMLHAIGERAVVQVIETDTIGAAPVDRFLARSIGRLTGSTYLVGQAVPTARRRGRHLASALEGARVDVIVAIAASQDIAYLPAGIPVIQVTDATPVAIAGLYPMFRGVHALSRWQAGHVDRRARDRTHAFAVASEWARNSLIRDYGVEDDRVSVVPFGPGIVPGSQARPPMGGRSLRVLAVASDWERKGGDAVIEVARRARAAGLPVELTVVGEPPRRLPDWIASAGRVARSDMSKVYSTHDVLLELAEANAGGVTMTDAHAHGLPVIATATGGTASIVDAGHSGFLVPQGTDGFGPALEALSALSRPEVWEAFSAAARSRHGSTLNWDVWADRVLCMARRAARLA